MARINMKDSGKFASGTSDYFSLKDDGDTAKVRFLYNEPDGSDMDYYLVHEIKLEDGKHKYVSCLAVDDEGHMHKDDCPLCKAGIPTKEKLFLQLYNEDEHKLMIWERGATFVGKIVAYLNRYGSLVSRPMDVTRRGRKGDKKTSYELFAGDKDDKTLADFPEKINIEGRIIVKATAQDMQDMVNGVYEWENKDTKNESTNTRHRSRGTRDYDDAF